MSWYLYLGPLIGSWLTLFCHLPLVQYSFFAEYRVVSLSVVLSLPCGLTSGRWKVGTWIRTKTGRRAASQSTCVVPGRVAGDRPWGGGREGGTWPGLAGDSARRRQFACQPATAAPSTATHDTSVYCLPTYLPTSSRVSELTSVDVFFRRPLSIGCRHRFRFRCMVRWRRRSVLTCISYRRRRTSA